MGAGVLGGRPGDAHPVQQVTREAMAVGGAPGDAGVPRTQMRQRPGAQSAVTERTVDDHVGDHALGALLARPVGHLADHPADMDQQQALLPCCTGRGRLQQPDRAIGQEPAPPPAPTPSGAPVPASAPPWRHDGLRLRRPTVRDVPDGCVIVMHGVAGSPLCGSDVRVSPGGAEPVKAAFPVRRPAVHTDTVRPAICRGSLRSSKGRQKAACQRDGEAARPRVHPRHGSTR